MDPKVKAYLEKKYGFAQGLADEDITAAQDQAQSTMRTANVGEAADQIGAAIAGTKADASYWDKQRQDADRGVKDIQARRQGMMQNMQFGEAATQAADQDDQRTRENDPNSQETQLLRRLGQKMAPSFDFSKLTGAQIKERLPTLEKQYQIDNDAMNRKEARADRWAMHRGSQALQMEALNDKRAEKQMKQQELDSTQAKQKGLYEMGTKAEEQYNKAIADGSYDPTESFQPIDNSTSEWVPNILKNNKAVEAQAAQSAWVESYLRDASGAAIPPSERMAYAKDYFPRPGDSPDVVKNKAELRRQKSENARTAAGGDRKLGPRTEAPPPMPPMAPKNVDIDEIDRILKSRGQ